MTPGLPETVSWGVTDGFPALGGVRVGGGSGGIPSILEQPADRGGRTRSWLPVKLKHEPSFYFPRNWRSTFMIDRYAVQNRHTIGVENMMWSSDYPHHGCDWPETRRVVDDMFRDVAAAERRRICALNAAELYRLV